MAETVQALAEIAKQKIRESGNVEDKDEDMLCAGVDVIAKILIGWIEAPKHLDRIATALERSNDLVQSPVLAPVSAPPVAPSTSSKPLA